MDQHERLKGFAEGVAEYQRRAVEAREAGNLDEYEKYLAGLRGMRNGIAKWLEANEGQTQ
jgi:hypothetical protein